MNLRRLRYFVKIVDIGSLTQAADVLHIAQPALSQQIATLEEEFRRQLLARTKRGVTPTDAGQILDRHAQIILRQLEQAQSDIDNSGQSLSGQVSVGLAPGTAASALALPLLKAIRAAHPAILLYLNENFGTMLSELVMNGRMDMAVLYAGKTVVHGLSFQPLLKERLFLIAPRSMPNLPPQIDLGNLGTMDLLLPRPYNYLRKYVDEAFATLQMSAHVVAEIESVATLNAAVAAGLGATDPPGVGRAGHGEIDPGAAVRHRLASDRGSARPVRLRPPAAVRARAGRQGDHPRVGRAADVRLRPG